MATDLERAFEALKAKQSNYDMLFAYYDGEQPLTYTATRLKDIFKDLDAYFAENWCSVVIDSTRDRINLREIQVKNAAAAKVWKEMWERTELNLESDETHEAALVAGEAYVIVWKDNEGQVDVYANDPRLCHIFYDAQFPRKKKYAAKWFVDDKKKIQLTLYYPDHLEYYKSRPDSNNVSGADSFDPMKTAKADNPFGQIPVFHFRLAQRKTRSDLKSVIAPQNGINKLLTDMMVTAEYLAFPQRYIISNAETKGKIKNAPNEIMDLPAGDGLGQQTQAGQFAMADLENYLKAIDNLATAISSITRTPKHYFFSIGSNLSGEALIAMEAPLNKKAQDRIDRFIPVWKQVALFMLKVAGQEVKPEEVEPVFDKPETIQPSTQSQTRAMNVSAGMPLVTVLREEGKSEEFIKQMQKDQAETDKKKADMASAYLEQARRNFDQNQNGAQNSGPIQNGNSGTQQNGGVNNAA
jgi:SPP1 family phage portal protein